MIAVQCAQHSYSCILWNPRKLPEMKNSHLQPERRVKSSVISSGGAAEDDTGKPHCAST